MPKLLKIGPSTEYVGKTLWEILGNLNNHGVGRIVQRNIYNRYPEPTYYRILKVETLAAPSDSKDSRKVRAYAEKVFRGRKFEKIFEIWHESWKPDFKLVPKSEENKLIELAESFSGKFQQKTLPSHVPFPALLKELIMRDKEPHSEEPLLKIVIRNEEDQLYKIADSGETPTIEYFGGKGTPLHPKFYEIPPILQEKYCKQQP